MTSPVPERQRAPVAPGRCSFDLPLGPIVARVLDLPTTHDFVAEHYDPFCEPVDPSRHADLVVTCTEGTGVIVPLPPPGGSTRLELDPLGEQRYRIRSHWQDGTIDLATGRGEMILTDRVLTHFRMSVENYLRIASQLVLIERGAFLMHTAGLLDGGRCFLFFGPSGAGKSTATLNSAPRRALSDDMVVIDVSGARPIAHAVPFFGLFPPADRTRGAFPLAAACRLHKAPEDRLERLSPARAVATVSASVPFVHELRLQHEGLTALVARMVATVPVCDLHLVKGPGFWNLLDREFPPEP